MLEVHSPLGTAARFERDGVSMFETPDFTLTQVAGEEKILKKRWGRVPCKVGTASQNGECTILRIGPKQFWLLGETIAPSEGVYVTPLSSGRTRIGLEGTRARQVLAACAVIDFDQSQFKLGHFVMTGIHHTPVTIHCVGDNRFHIYALRTFALNAWEWLCDIAEGLDHA